ncbi:2-succinylbenzoate--CoA ligase [Scytonema sp. NUACC21]
MVKILENLIDRAFALPHDWLICDRNHLFTQIAEQRYLELMEFSHKETPPKIFLAEDEPVRFLASFIAASAARCQVFLCNPTWAKPEWQQVFDLGTPDIIWGIGEENTGIVPDKEDKKKTLLLPSSLSNFPLIMVPTGGSSGKIKFAIHTWETLMASVRGFKEYFQIDRVHSFCVLPLYHVSGLMQFIRSFTTFGNLVILSFKELEAGQIYNINPSEFFISLVPTQLQRFLKNPELTEWLSQFSTVLLGGAPAWNELLEQARYHKIRLAPTYGMTETASQIATLKPDDFLSGKDGCTRILPHVQVSIYNEKGISSNVNQIGNIRIYSQSLSLGYYPKIRVNQEYLQVDDLGFFDEQGYLHVSGRDSDKIITGGENVYPLEVESAIRETQMVTDICVIGVPDKVWGQAVTAIYIPKMPNLSPLTLKTLLKDKLSKFKVPKYWIGVDSLPRNSQGKVNRLLLQQIAINSLEKNIL